MKAILVIDIDENHLHKETMELYERLKGYKCLLKPMPQKKEISLSPRQDTKSITRAYNDTLAIGYNSCLNEILGETE